MNHKTSRFDRRLINDWFLKGRVKQRFLAIFMLLSLGDLPLALPCQAESEASSSAGTEAGLEAPGLIGRRRRGRRGWYRNQINQANRMAAQRETKRASELARQQHRDDQTQIKREQNLARSSDRAFVKEYGQSNRPGRRKRRNLGGFSQAGNSPAGSSLPNLSAGTPATAHSSQPSDLSRPQSTAQPASAAATAPVKAKAK